MLHSISSRSISILLSHLCIVLSNNRSINFPYQNSVCTSPPPVLSILFHSALQHSVSSAVHEAPHYAISCSPMLSHSSQRLKAEDSSSVPHLLHKRIFGSPTKWKCPHRTILRFLSLQNIVCYWLKFDILFHNPFSLYLKIQIDWWKLFRDNDRSSVSDRTHRR